MLSCKEIKATATGLVVDVDSLKHRLGYGALQGLYGKNHVDVVMDEINAELDLGLLPKSVLIELVKIQSVLEVLV